MLPQPIVDFWVRAVNRRLRTLLIPLPPIDGELRPVLQTSVAGQNLNFCHDLVTMSPNEHRIDVRRIRVPAIGWSPGYSGTTGYSVPSHVSQAT